MPRFPRIRYRVSVDFKGSLFSTKGTPQNPKQPNTVEEIIYQLSLDIPMTQDVRDLTSPTQLTIYAVDRPGKKAPFVIHFLPMVTHN